MYYDIARNESLSLNGYAGQQTLTTPHMPRDCSAIRSHFDGFFNNACNVYEITKLNCSDFVLRIYGDALVSIHMAPCYTRMELLTVGYMFPSIDQCHSADSAVIGNNTSNAISVVELQRYFVLSNLETTIFDVR
jgi:hypothetical protein